MYRLLEGFPQSFHITLILILSILLLILFIITYVNSKILFEYKKKKERQDFELEKNKVLIKNLEHRFMSLKRENSNHVNYLNSVFTSMNEGILVFNPELEIVLANPFAMTILDLDNSIFFNETDKKHVEIEKLKSMIQDVEKNQESYELVVSKNQELYLKYVVDKITDKYNSDKELGFFVSIYDVSETELNNALRNEFIENISHEFKTPMTIILGYVETLMLWDDLDEKLVRRSLEVIDIEVSRLNAMVNQLLKLTKVNGDIDINETNINVISVIKSIVIHFESLCKKSNVKIQMEYEEDSIDVVGDKLLFINAISNILDNAIKYTYEFDTILIRIVKNHNDCVISILDHGPGIQSDHLKRIFDRFYRVDKDRNSTTGGTGLGLAITRDSIERIGGTLQVKSKLDKGTEFIIKLPLNIEKGAV